MQSQKKIAVLGANPIGSVLAILLALKGYQVEIFEKNSHPENSGIIDREKRQINFGVSLRGVQAFQRIQLWEKVKKYSIPMNARTIHHYNGTIRHHQYGRRNEAIYSIRSELLTNLLIKQLKDFPDQIKVNFETRIQDIDIEQSSINFVNPDGTLNRREFTQVFLTDDSFKIIKKNLIFQKGFKFNQDYSHYGFIETYIPANSMQEFQYSSNSLHLWTHDDFHIIAMPNKNKTFTCNLFLPLKGKVSFETIKTQEDFHKFMITYFPALADNMNLSTDSFNPKNIGMLYDHKCYPWVFKNFCLFGNAAHQIFPYYGQDFNAGLEDCTILSELIDLHRDDWKTITDLFQTLRKPNTDAINDLSKNNFHDLRGNSFDEDFQEKKIIINYLSENYEDLFMSQYQLIEFSNIEFSKAQSFGKVEEEIVKQIKMIPDYEKIIESGKRNSIIRQILRNYVGKYDVETSAVEIISQLGTLSINQEVILIPHIGQFEVNRQENCSFVSKSSLNEQLQMFQEFQGIATRIRGQKNSKINNFKIVEGTKIGLCMEIVQSDNEINIDLKSLKEAYDIAIIKSIQQSMKNIRNIYKYAIIKLHHCKDMRIPSLSVECVNFILEQGFEVIAINSQQLEDVHQQSLCYDKFLSSEEHLVIEMIDASKLDPGAYLVDLDLYPEQGDILPCTIKVKRILNADLIDIYAHKKKECYYSEYIAVEELIDLMRNRTDLLEEKLFIRVHQINELSMQQSIITLVDMIKIFKDKQVLEKLETIEEYMNQILGFFKVQTETNFVLCSMSTKAFVYGFRSALGTASGVQSCQFYIMQILLGLSMDRHILNDPEKLKCLKEYDILKIKSYQNEKSMFQVIQEWLLQMHDEVEDIQKIYKYKHLDAIVSGCKDFSKPVAVAVLYILNNQDCVQAKIINNLLKFEESFLTFLDSHIILVDHHLGDRRGTGKSSGGNYLRNSKMSLIIWRDLYYLQKHAKSVIDWKEIEKPIKIKLPKNDPYYDIVSELRLKNEKEEDEVLDFIGNNSEIEKEIKEIIKKNFIQNIDKEIQANDINQLGLKSARETFAQQVSIDQNIIDSEKVAITCGVKQAVNYITKFLLKKGDNVIVTVPCQSDYFTILKENHIEPRYLNLLGDNGLSLNVDQLREIIDKNTKAIILSNTLNIMGQGLINEDLEKVHEVCQYFKIPVVYDERTLFSNQQMKEQIEHIFQKVPILTLTGTPYLEIPNEYNIGIIYARDDQCYFNDFFKELKELQISQIVQPSVVAQNSIKDILEYSERYVKGLQENDFENNEQLYQRCSKLRGLQPIKSKFSRNFMIKLELSKFKDIEDDIEFVKKILIEQKCKLLPTQALLHQNAVLIVILYFFELYFRLFLILKKLQTL